MHRTGKVGYKYGYKYGVGFPASFRDLVLRRLPYDVCHKPNLYVLFADAKGKVEVFDWRKMQSSQKGKRSERVE